jgi:Rod binding domain-containing protein
VESSSVTGENPFQIPANILTNPGTRLEAQIRAVRGLPDEKFASELKAASQEFEAVFIAYLLKVMRDTIEESGLMDGGFGKSIYTELFDQEVSLTIARRGMLGMSDLLYQNLLSGTSMDKIGEPPTESSRDPAFESQGPAYSGIEKPKQLGDYGSRQLGLWPERRPVFPSVEVSQGYRHSRLRRYEGDRGAAWEGCLCRL